MFNSIRGTITEKTGELLRMETGGLEWDIAVPATDLDVLPPPGAEGRVFTWLYHKEDQMRLFGFAGEARRATFLELLKVEGIGPRGALKIMGGIDQEELERALETEDLARLEAVPGLGKKTAQKMILSLRGKLAFSKDSPAKTLPYGDLVEALSGMGYDKRLAVNALERAAAELSGDLKGPEQEQELFKRAIVILSGGA
ncbi:MAG: Holliday junction branch migration protein RuvA [Spirochaetaceae bacterium]|jgi:Holliday junction DNA helicase RuvA|nr:Holliday junction branch migration protein RuvA [Spirochaetaceae bacterium]